MADEQNNLPDQALERAIRALQKTPVPDGPPPEVVNRTVAALEAGAPKTLTTTRRILTMKTLTRLAAAAVLAAAIVGLLFWISTPKNASIAFADVLKTVRDVRSMKCKEVVRVDLPGRGVQTMSAEVLVADAARMRCTMSPGPSAGVFIQIQDLRQGKILMLMPAKKQAMLAEIANSPMQQINLLKEFQDAEPRSGKPIGQREIGGRQAKGFNVTEPGMRLQMWVDAETKLPVLAEMDAQAGMMPASHVTFTDFAWNVPVDESLLSLTPPAGYQMLPAMKMDMSPASEKDLVAGLKAIAELNGGAFPPGVDMAGLMGIMKQMDKRFDKFDKAQQDKFMGEVRASMLQIGRMWMFIGDSKNGEDWHYAGEGAPFGQAGRPVFWYRPTGAATYRVINADLTVHDVPPENLPKIPSKIVTKPMIAPAPTPPNR